MITEVDYCPETGDQPGAPFCRCGQRAIPNDAVGFCSFCKTMYLAGLNWNGKGRGWSIFPPAATEPKA